MDNNNSLQNKRIFTLCAMGFFMIFGYGFAKPCIDSLFLEHYRSELLPIAWLATAFFSLITVAIYNRFNQKFAILTLYGSISLLCSAILVILLGSYLFGFIPAIFMLYVFKELYSVVLMETYWSFADIVFSIGTARFSYGIAMAACSVGGILGNLAVGPVARAVGSKYAMGLLLFFLLIGSLIAHLARNLADEKPKSSKKKTDLSLGLKTLLASKYLVPLAFLVCTVQVVIALIDYAFNSQIQDLYVNTDMRTELFGQIHAAINVVAIGVQIATGPLLRIIGIGNTFLCIPLLVSVFIFAFIIMPHFALNMALKISSKALDYSLFRAVKEILYIPLSREEKTQGKGIIDIFMYRLARGLSSLVIVVLIAFGIIGYVMHVSLLLAICWLMLAIIIAKRYQLLVKNKEDS